jgi:hypothetical protein
MELMEKMETKARQFQLHQLLPVQLVRREFKARKVKRVRKAKQVQLARADRQDLPAQLVQRDRKDHQVAAGAEQQDQQVQPVRLEQQD